VEADGNSLGLTVAGEPRGSPNLRLVGVDEPGEPGAASPGAFAAAPTPLSVPMATGTRYFVG
jgi:hypothetical protein